MRTKKFAEESTLIFTSQGQEELKLQPLGPHP